MNVTRHPVCPLIPTRVCPLIPTSSLSMQYRYRVDPPAIRLVCSTKQCALAPVFLAFSTPLRHAQTANSLCLQLRRWLDPQLLSLLIREHPFRSLWIYHHIHHLAPVHAPNVMRSVIHRYVAILIHTP